MKEGEEGMNLNRRRCPVLPVATICGYRAFPAGDQDNLLIRWQDHTGNLVKIPAAAPAEVRRKAFRIHRAAAKSLSALFLTLSESSEIPLTVRSAFRGVGWQRDFFLRDLRQRRDFRKTIRFIAPPGYSEHHTGLVVDFAGDLTWAQRNLPLWGWALSPHRGNTSNFQHPPRRWRYIGRSVLEEVLQQGELTASERDLVLENLTRFNSDDFSSIFPADESVNTDALEHGAAIREALLGLELCDELSGEESALHRIVGMARDFAAEHYATTTDLEELRCLLETAVLLLPGDTSPRVELLHGRLSAVFGEPLSGATYSELSEKMVRSFQQGVGLPATGAVDNATQAALRRAGKNSLDLLNSQAIAELAQGVWRGRPAAPRLDRFCLLPSSLPGSELAPLSAAEKARAPLPDNHHRHWLTDLELGEYPSDASCLCVDRRVRAMARLARHARRHLSGQVVAITGSSGKTTTKNLLRLALMAQGLPYASGGSGNSTAAICRELICAPLAADWLIVESGLGATGSAIRDHSDLLRPDVAIITSINVAHAAGYQSIDEIAIKKMEIARHLVPGGVLLLDADSPMFPCMQESIEKFGGRRWLGFGFADSADIRVSGGEFSLEGGRFSVELAGRRHEVTLPLIGRHWAKMVAAVLGCCTELGVELESVIDNLRNFRVPAGRGTLEKIELCHGRIDIFDSHYNANPGSMQADLDAFQALCNRYPERRSWAVIGEYKELGPLTAAAHHELGVQLSAMGFDKIFLIGERQQESKQSIEGCEVSVFATVEEALPLIVEECTPGDLLFIKGSHSNNLHRVAATIRQKLEQQATATAR